MKILMGSSILYGDIDALTRRKAGGAGQMMSLHDAEAPRRYDFMA
ncbi:hypothetical protein GCM10027288_23280 [Bordetella tumbae]